MGEVKPLVKLIAYTPEPEKVVATAAKLCYSQKSAFDITESMTNEEAVGFLDKLPSSHGTPLESAVFTFSIEGVSRSCTHQIVRHRLASYNQRSQRYVSEEDLDYVIPEKIKENDFMAIEYIYNYNDGEDNFTNKATIEAVFKEAMRYAEHYYNTLLTALIKSGVPEKIAQENARAVLPNACASKMIMTVNARELHHFFNQRCCSRAQDEIREVANQILALCKEVAPVLFKDAGPFCVGDKCPEGSMSCGKQKEMKEFYNNL